MIITFLGTASCYPTTRRAVTSVAVKFESGCVWMIDCGEGTQIQLQKSSIKQSKITKIFITHLHGDHLFGLPGFLCTLSTLGTERENFTLEIYGPLGIARYVRESLNLSRSPLTFKYKVFELIPQDSQYPNNMRTDWPIMENADSHRHPMELPSVSIPVTGDENPVWDVIVNHEECQVKASRVEHRIPTFGYVLIEANKVGTIDVEYLKKLGLQPGPSYAKLKNGSSVTLPDGTVIHPKDCIGPDKLGRKITILGDTNDSSKMIDIAKNSDVLIHEATLEDSMRSKAIVNGHSTPSMAVDFSHKILASKLILYHFSQRYINPGQMRDQQGTCTTILFDEAKAALAKYPGYSCQVVISKDLMEVDVPRK